MEILHQIKSDNTIVAVGRHQGMDIDPDKMMFDREKSILNQLSPRKRSEWLASRELLFRIAKLPERVECLYDDFGKPYLKGINKHISVSHSEEWCSAMVSDKSCGVDIQVYSDTVQRISNRFLSASELGEIENVKNKLHFLHLYWGAKECMYKAYGKRKLEFRSHIYVHSINVELCTAVGEIKYEDIHLLYDIHYRILPEAAWVFCLQRSTTGHPDQPWM
ncbi:MAG: 4'-phosphopantetheinyl transferase superfamily protein [Saprospiraceae bacterium]